MRELWCLWCGGVVEVAQPLTAPRPGQRGPEAGDFAICTNCASIMVYIDAHSFRYPTPDEMRVLSASPDGPRLRADQEYIITRRTERERWCRPPRAH